jgi:serine/threonine-protein kinase
VYVFGWGLELTMALTAGTRLGIYEITGQLGAGGMGEVYRARDTKLGREVAIKTLPSALASDKDRLARFEREAKLLAALNHAHIAAVYGLDAHEGTHYLAMELVEGETLEKKLKTGPLPVEDALRLALQIAEALEAAHGKGVVHRDLKPANIMLTREGQAKVLDFGLAKAFSGVAGEASPAHSPALSLAMTQAGLVLGTAGYMSPEQASGQGSDQRADVWAFGVVLYEMLTGLPVFKGESVPHILADVLKTEPDWNRLPKNLHPRVRQLLERCLTKKPRSRMHSIADARIEIEAALADPEGAEVLAAVQTGQPARASWPRLAAAALVGAAATAGLAALAGGYLRPTPAPEPRPVVRFSAPIPMGTLFTTDPLSTIALSRDGTQLAYAADNGIYVRNLGQTDALLVPGTVEQGVGAATPAFSPDGQWLVYVHVMSAVGPFAVKRVPISGGAPVVILDEAGLVDEFPHGLSWPTPDSILFANREGVVRLPANGGAAEVLVQRADTERFYSPQILPAGDAVLFTRVAGSAGTTGGYEAAQVVVQSIGQDDRTVVWEGGSAARYLPTGHLVYAQGTALFAIPFDATTRAVRGGPVPLVQGLRRSPNGFTDTATFAISDNGTLALIPGDPNAQPAARIETTLSWIDRDGNEEPLPIRPDDYTMVRISPDGTKVALVVGAQLGRDLPPTIWIYDFATGNLRLLASDPPVHDAPVWSADGSRIFVRAGRPPETPISVQAIELETGEASVVAETSPDFPFLLPWAVAPDGRTLGLVNAMSLTDVNVATLSLEDGTLTSLLSGPGNQNQPSFTPDGAWVAVSEQPEGGAIEINLRPFPAAARTRIPVGRGESPVFSRDGSELFFFDGQGIASAPIAYTPTLSVGTPRRLFEASGYLWALYGRSWDPAPSGERFLAIRAPSGADDAPSETRQINVVLNWLEELKSRVPVNVSGGRD